MAILPEFSHTLEVLLKMAPLAFLILLGAVIGRIGRIEREPLVKFLVYGVMPPAFALNVMIEPIQASFLGVALIVAMMSCFLALLILRWTRCLGFTDTESRLLAFSSGTANTGYFGLSAVVALVGEQALPSLITVTLAFIFFEGSVGAYILARNQWDRKQAIKQALKLPAIYAIAVGIIVSKIFGGPGIVGLELARTLRGAYVTLGMVILGMTLSQTLNATTSRSMALVSVRGRLGIGLFLVKYLVWPLGALGMIELDRARFGLFSEDFRQVLRIMSVSPIAVNLVLFSNLFGMQSKRLSFWVLLSVCVSLVALVVL